MKEIHKSMLQSTVEFLNIVGVKNNDIMVCGSVALDICGLFPPYRYRAHDVDVCIRVTPQQEKDIKDLIRIMNQLDKPKENQGSESSTWVVNLNKSGVIVNLWFYRPDSSFDTDMRLESGVWVETPADCFRKKRSYGRVKDYQDLNSIFKNFM